MNKAVTGVITLFVLGIVAASPASAENTQDKQCRDIHVLVERPSGILVCLTEKTAEGAADRLGWKIIVGTSADKTVQNPENPKSPDDTSIQDDPCYDITENAEYPYVLVEPINHSITSGDFVKLCVQSPNKWFKIYLDADDEWLPSELTDDEINHPRNYPRTYAAGSITLEVPKGIVDQKHYDPDYLDCNDAYYLDGKYDYPQYRNYKVEHIAQTDKSHTLKFTYAMPVSEISYFGSFAIFDDNRYYSTPNVCIKDYELDNYDLTKPLPWSEPDPNPSKPCQHILGLNYTITSGQVYKICGDSWGEFVEFHLNNVTSNAELTVDIPLMQMRPYYPNMLDNVVFDRNTDANDSGCQPPRELLFRNQEYQTFKIPILAGASYVYIGYVLYDYGSPHPLSEIIAAVEPFDRSKDDVTEKC